MSQETQTPQPDTIDKHLPEGSEVFSTINEDGLDIHLVRSPGYNDGDQALLVVHTKMSYREVGLADPDSLERVLRRIQRKHKVSPDV